MLKPCTQEDFHCWTVDHYKSIIIPILIWNICINVITFSCITLRKESREELQDGESCRFYNTPEKEMSVDVS